MSSTRTASASTDLLAEMRDFILEQADGRAPETLARYALVAHDLTEFLAGVDVTPWLGPQIGEHYERERQRLGEGAFLATLGTSSLIRVLPAFVADPWLPPPGAQRRTHRAAVRSLIKLVRIKAMEQRCFRSGDFRVLDRALGRAYQLDHDHGTKWPEGGRVTCAVTLELGENLVDVLLDQVTRGLHATFDEAVAARLDEDEARFGRLTRQVW